MADLLAGDVELPALGRVKKQHVAIFAAGVGAVVVFAYYRRARELSAGEEQLLGEDDLGYEVLGADPYETPGPSGLFGEDDHPTNSAPLTNAEWSERATDALDRRGFDDNAAAIAIGKYLDRQPLTPAELDMVRVAVAMVGPPPQNGPFDYVPAGGGGAAVGLPAPTGFTATPGPESITWTWTPVTGAQGYVVELIAGQSKVIHTASPSAATYTSGVKLAPAHSYRIAVYAKNTAGQRGARGTHVASTSSTPPASGMTVAGLRVEGSNAVDITWIWTPTPGAKAYGVELIAGSGEGRKSLHRTIVKTPRYQVTRSGGPRLQPKHTYRVRVWAINAFNNEGPAATATGTTK